MKILPIALLSMAFALGISAQPTLTITEQNETLTADYNGTAVPLILTGPVDGWTVQLPDDFVLFPQGIVPLGEPENALQINNVNVGTSPQFLIWESDVPVTFAPGLPTKITIVGAGVHTTVAGQAETFNLVLQDLPKSAPDSGTTALLLGGAATLLATLRRRVIS